MLIATLALIASCGMVILLAEPDALICIQSTSTDTQQCWQPQNVQIVALLWIIGCLIGLTATIGTLRDALIERQQAKDDPILGSIATANVRREVFRLLELLALLLIGLAAITSVAATILSRLGLLFVVTMIVWNAHLDRREREITEHLIRLARAHVEGMHGRTRPE